LAKINNGLKLYRTLLIVQSCELAKITSDINKDAVVNWKDEIELLAFDKKKLPKDQAKNYIEENSKLLLNKLAEQEFERIVVMESVQINIDLLKDEQLPIRVIKSGLTFSKVIIEELKIRNLHWQSYAMIQWSKSSIKHASPDVLVQQFAELGYSQIGKHLLKNLRVVTDAELRESFKTSDAEKIGLRVVHAFFHDDESGSSSITIKNVLEHLYPSSEVVAIDIANLEQMVKSSPDVVYIYEDGLWSGVELVKRLNAICSRAEFRNSNVQLHFKYCLTSDSGLIAARFFAKREYFGRLQFTAATHGNHFTFLKSGFDTTLMHLTDPSDNQIRETLDAEIEPHAFRNNALWENDRETAVFVCSEIGKQLIRPFLLRQAMEKVNVDCNVNVTTTIESVSEEKIERWQLGAAGFASTVVFASSVPKPVLPLFWLEGNVSLGGKTVNWRPLFWDARRTGCADKLP
jgi:hypothetical protein